MNPILRKWTIRENRNARLAKRENYIKMLYQAESFSNQDEAKTLLQNIAEEEQNLRERFVFLEKEFGFTKAELKTIVEPDNKLFSCPEKELKLRIPYFIDLFNGVDNFKKTLNKNGHTLFSVKKVMEIAERLTALVTIFRTDKQGAIELAIANRGYLGQSTEKVLSRIEDIGRKQCLDYEECISLLKEIPEIFSWTKDDMAALLKKWRGARELLNENSEGVKLKIRTAPKKSADEPNTIILSNRLAKGVFSTRIIHEYETQANKNSFGFEEFTRDIPNVGEDALRHLDENGFSRIGETVREGDILVGKVTPKIDDKLTPEERLLKAIYGDKFREVKDTSLRVPYRVDGKVVDVQVDPEYIMPRTAKVKLQQDLEIKVGDVLTDSDGNSGIVTKIDSEISDCDIVANFPLGCNVKKTHIAERLLFARSTGPYGLDQRPIGDYGGARRPQKLTYNDLVKLQSCGLIDAYQNMTLFQGKNPALQVELCKQIFKGQKSNVFALPSFDLNRFKAFFAATCIDLFFVDKEGNEVSFTLSDKTQLERLYNSGDISVRLRALTDKSIEEMSYGEVTKPETINYRTHLPESGGLFCEKIFGPMKDYKCGCGKYTRVRYKGVVCDRCGVEVTNSAVRFERMGHIELAVSIEHPLLERVIINKIPVLPPELRPMILLPDNRFVTSDLNDLYSRVINRNNRIAKLKELGAPQNIIAHEVRMLREAVDNLFFGGVNGAEGHSLISMIDHIRELLCSNIESEAFDYSASCGVCPNDSLSDTECNLPCEVALELFKPFVMHELVEQGTVHNLKSAKRLVERYLYLGTDAIYSSNTLDKSDEIGSIGLSVRTYSCLKRHGIHTLDQLCKLTCDEVLKVRNLGRLGADEVRLKISNLVRNSDGSYRLTKEKSIFAILEELLSRYKIIILGDEKDSEIVLAKPIITKDCVLGISNSNYNKLKATLKAKVRIFLAASDFSQELCLESKSPVAAKSLFEVEKENDFVKTLANEVMNGVGNIEHILADAVRQSAKCTFSTTVSRLIFGVPTSEAWKRYKFSDVNENEEEAVLDDFPGDNFDLEDLFADTEYEEDDDLNLEDLLFDMNDKD